MAMQYLGTGLERVADVGLATAIATRHLAATIGAIRTSGYSAPGKGAASYVSDALATAGLAAAHPRVCKQSLDGRYWRLLVENGIHTPFQFGALSDGADDTAALVAMAAYVNTLYDGAAADSFGNVRFPQIVFTDCAGFRMAASAGVGLALRAGVQIDMSMAPLLITGAANTAIIGFHHTNPHPGSLAAPRRGHSILDVRRVTPSDWTTEGDIGVKVDAAYAAHYKIKRLENFCVGGEFCLGYGLIEGGEVVEARKGLIVTARGAPDNFSNQIALRDIEFTTRGAAGTARYGLVLKGTAPIGINTVSLDNLSFELAKSLAGAQDCLDLLIDGSASNISQVIGRGLRTESGGDVHVRTLGAVRDVDIEYNHAELAYDHPEGLFLDDQSTGAGAISVRRAHNANGRQWKPFFTTGRLAENAVKTNTGHCFIRNLESATNVGAFPATQTFETGNFEPTFYADGSMDGGSLYGTRVKLNGARSIAIRGRKPAGQAATLIVLLFNAAGVQLGTDNLVWSEQFGSICNTAVYGGSHPVSINPANGCTTFEAVLGFAANVATAFITVASRVMEWELLAADKRPAAFSATSHFKDRFIGNAIPVALANVTYPAGMQVDNTVVASWLASGWRYNGTTWEVADVIADDAVSNINLANVATATIKGRATAGTGDPEDLTAAQVRTLINVANGATANSADATLLARANHTGTQAAATISDFTEASQDVVGAMVAAAGGSYNDGAGTITLPGGGVSDGDKGDITVSGSGAAWSIDNGAVSLAKMADVASGTVFYRKTAASGAPEVQTLALLKTDLGLSGTNSGDQTSVSGNAGTATALAISRSFSISGGGITAAAIGFDGTAAVALSASVDSGHITLARMANLAANSFLGNNTGSAATPLALTVAQSKALLAIVSTDISDFTEASQDVVGAMVTAAGGSYNDGAGTIALPGGSPGGNSGKLQYNNAGAFAGAANIEVEGGNLKLVSTTDPAAPTGGLLLYSRLVAGRHLPKIVGPVGIDTVLQVGLHGNATFMVAPASGTTAPTGWGGTLTTATTMSMVQTIASSSPWQATQRKRFASAATAASVTGMRTAYVQWFRGSAAGYGGFFFRTQIGQNINLNGAQVFHGLCASTAALGTAAGSVAALINMIGMGYDTTDASTGNWFLYRNDGTGTATKVDLGATNAARNTTHGYDLFIYCPPGAATEIFVRVVNLHTNVVVLDTSYTTDLPAVNTGLAYKGEGNNGAVASAMNLEVAKVYIETDY